MRQHKRLLAAVLGLVLLTGCAGGLLRTFRVGVSTTLPFVATLVTEGVISQSVANTVTADVNDGISAAVKCDQCLKAIADSVTGKLRQAAKAKCYVALAGNLRTILGRHNIGGVAQLDRIARIIEAGIAAFEEYNRDVTTDPTVAAVVEATRDSSQPRENPDEKLKKAMEQMKDDMREATKSVDRKTGKVRYLFPLDSAFLVAR